MSSPTPAMSAAPPAWRVLVRFLAILGALNLAYYAEKKLELGMVDVPYTRLVTVAAGSVADAVFPYTIQTMGNVIVAGENTYVAVVSGCNGLEAIFLMLAGILAFPGSWGRRWRALAAYLPALFGLNLVRVVGLVHIAKEHPEHMDLAHYQIAQGILIVFVLFFWVRYVRQPGE